jgi:OOP family OmpA-OmpF porin
VAQQSFAQVAPGWYVGGNVGKSSGDFDDGRIIGVPPATVTGTSSDDRDTSYKLYGGYQFHRNFAVEGGYFDLGRFNYGYTTAGGAFSGDTRYRGLNLDLVGTLPVWDRLSVIGRVGAAYTRQRTSISTTGGLPDMGGSRTDNSWGPKVGVGLEYAFTPSLAVRAEWERYRIREGVRGRGDVDVATIGLVYRFGAPAMTRVVAPAPTYVPAPAPAPAPAARVETPPPAPQYTPPPPPPPAPAPAPAARPYRN